MSADEPPRPNFPGRADAIECLAPIKDNTVIPINLIKIKDWNKNRITLY
jgi:hypothetical protein